VSDVTKDEVAVWRDSPVGQAVFEFLRTLRDSYEDSFAISFDGEKDRRAAHLRGRSQGVQDAIDVVDMMFPQEEGEVSVSSSA